MNWRRRFLLLGFMLIVFAAGVVIGSVVTVRLAQQRIQERLDPQSWQPRTMSWLRTELKLTDEQNSRVEPIVSQAIGELKYLKEQGERERQAIFGRMFGEIGGVLTTQQQESLRSILRKSAVSNPDK